MHVEKTALNHGVVIELLLLVLMRSVCKGEATLKAVLFLNIDGHLGILMLRCKPIFNIVILLHQHFSLLVIFNILKTIVNILSPLYLPNNSMLIVVNNYQFSFFT